VAVLIPSIDLMGGKIVQLEQGSRKVLEFDDFTEWVARFSSYPLVQLIDLDAAIGSGHNSDLIRQLARLLPCQVGGGIRSVEAAEKLLDLGARRVIFGSSLVSDGSINGEFARDAASLLGAENLVFAVDCRGGHVAIRGWQETTGITALEMMGALQPYCGAFLYTHIDAEGLLGGFPQDIVRNLRDATARRLIVAGGIRSQEEVDVLDAMGVDAVVGMAIYRGLLQA
jgi:phosphoribosylformimino-5-aminoimidazole carboxamide ribotide isomerase